MIPITVPNASDVTTNTAWTAKNAVGAAPRHERGSCQMLLKKVGQITHDQIAKASKNSEVRRETIIRPVLAVVGFGLPPGVASLRSCL